MATALLDKQETRQQEATSLDAAEHGTPAEYRWTVDAFTQAAEAGVFGYEARLELVHGRIINIMGQGPRHATLASEIAEMLREAFRPGFAIREEKPVRLSADSEPIPDIMVLNGRQADYSDRQPVPENVALVIEVSNTTAEYDLGEKALLYAQSGISDYWVVLVKDNAIVVHRQPSAESYQDIARLAGTDTISPLAMPQTLWTINELLERTEAQ